jgi:hypothetical protein
MEPNDIWGRDDGVALAMMLLLDRVKAAGKLCG